MDELYRYLELTRGIPSQPHDLVQSIVPEHCDHSMDSMDVMPMLDPTTSMKSTGKFEEHQAAKLIQCKNTSTNNQMADWILWTIEEGTEGPNTITIRNLTMILNSL